ncbi:unnamed protein product [Haemonchus placei]|uniref:PDEase domain-containing protein n=1 Tax=Haemonchus placei TaxID=6290 RepID=A0A0N4WS28_HAEPC|nr:unnamed protein product [Haemonchus placei]
MGCEINEESSGRIDDEAGHLVRRRSIATEAHGEENTGVEPPVRVPRNERWATETPEVNLQRTVKSILSTVYQRIDSRVFEEVFKAQSVAEAHNYDGKTSPSDFSRQ